ncbi:MAG: hypothetical protein PVG78_07925 [Desulfobacterales bacterium]|jgi:hypothetical protein
MNGIANRCIRLSILITFFACLPWGCGAALKFGRLPDVSRIEKELSLQTSTRDDVMRVLGEPRGGGGIFLPIDEHPRDHWFYYYEESTMKNAQRIFLFIFFDGNRYDGYMWFSSLPMSAAPALEANPSVCPECAGPMRGIAFIEQAGGVRKTRRR